jgi:leucyl-tRNA synthetase
MSEQYDPKTIEPKWQRVWAEAGADAVANPADRKSVV